MTKPLPLQILDFFRQPQPISSWSKLNLFNMRNFLICFQTLCLAIGGALVFGLIISFFTAISGIIPGDKNQVVSFLNDHPLWYVFLMVVLLGPFQEEVGFRLWLGGKKNQVLIGLAVLAFMVLSFFSTIWFSWFLNGSANSIWQLILDFSLIAFLLLGFGLGGFFNETEISNFWKSHFRSSFYFTTGFFAVLHIANYSSIGQIWWWLPFLVLPQFWIGILLGFIRIKLGFWWSLILHSSYNFALTFYFFAYQIFLGTQKASQAKDVQGFFKVLNGSNFLEFVWLNLVNTVIIFGILLVIWVCVFLGIETYRYLKFSAVEKSKEIN